MEDTRFDDLTRKLADRKLSRGGMIKLLLSSMVGGLAIRSGSSTAIAANCPVCEGRDSNNTCVPCTKLSNLIVQYCCSRGVCVQCSQCPGGCSTKGECGCTNPADICVKGECVPRDCGGKCGTCEACHNGVCLKCNDPQLGLCCKNGACLRVDVHCRASDSAGNCVRCADGVDPKCCSHGKCVSECPDCESCQHGKCTGCEKAGLCCYQSNSTGICLAQKDCPGGCCTNGKCGCPTGQVCDTGKCRPSKCNPSTCHGCCNGETCIPFNQQTGSMCGSGAQPCGKCASGICKNGACSSGTSSYCALVHQAGHKCGPANGCGATTGFCVCEQHKGNWYCVQDNFCDPSTTKLCTLDTDCPAGSICDGNCPPIGAFKGGKVCMPLCNC